MGENNEEEDEGEDGKCAFGLERSGGIVCLHREGTIVQITGE